MIITSHSLSPEAPWSAHPVPPSCSRTVQPRGPRLPHVPDDSALKWPPQLGGGLPRSGVAVPGLTLENEAGALQVHLRQRQLQRGQRHLRQGWVRWECNEIQLPRRSRCTATVVALPAGWPWWGPRSGGALRLRPTHVPSARAVRGLSAVPLPPASTARAPFPPSPSPTSLAAASLTASYSWSRWERCVPGPLRCAPSKAAWQRAAEARSPSSLWKDGRVEREGSEATRQRHQIPGRLHPRTAQRPNPCEKIAPWPRPLSRG